MYLTECPPTGGKRGGTTGISLPSLKGMGEFYFEQIRSALKFFKEA